MSNVSDHSIWPDDVQLQALGRVIQAASMFEDSLRNAFCSLIGSKYAAVVAGDEQSSSLIGKCKELTKARTEISSDQKEKILDILIKCKTANERRNRLVHDVWALGPNAVTHLMKRQRLGYQITSQPITTDEIDQVARDLTRSSSELLNILFDTFGPEQATLEAQLRWEQHVESMSTRELYALAVRRLAGMLEDLSRFFVSYDEQELSDWASRLRENVSSSPGQVAETIKTAYEENQRIMHVIIRTESRSEVPRWQAGIDPNTQLMTLNQQVLQVAAYLEGLDITEDESG